MQVVPDQAFGAVARVSSSEFAASTAFTFLQPSQLQVVLAVGGSRSARSVSIRVRISSRMGRTASTLRPAGSSSYQSSQRLPGKIGQASPQPIVMMTSEFWAASYSRRFGI